MAVSGSATSVPTLAKCLLLLSCFSGVFDTVAGVFGEGLKQEEKQLFLDLHNFHRASVPAADMRRLSWNEALESAARIQTELCDFQEEAATNIYYNDSALSNDASAVVTDIVSKWLSDPSVQQPIKWYKTVSIGCAASLCGRLTRDAGLPLTNSYLVVCKYAPRYFMLPDGSLYKSGLCRNSTCPPGTGVCVAYEGAARPSTVQLYPYCGTNEMNPSVPQDVDKPTTTRSISYATPRIGSVAGGTRVTIFGRGFSTNQFDGGNLVTMVPINGIGENITCDVESYSSSPEKIICVTRSAPTGTTNAYYDMYISINDGSGYVSIGSCGGHCRYRYHLNWWTPFLMNISTYASSYGDMPITVGGYLYSSRFEDPNDLEDRSSDNKDRDDNSYDSYSRILVGGRVCDPMRENGSWYESTISENGIVATVQCKAELGNIIDSHNVTVVLGRRGNSLVRPQDNLVTLDNKLRPHVFQTHADIVGVSPSSGSVGGGTKITITMNHTLMDYTDIAVKVGGHPCDNVTIVPSTSGYGQIECITRPRPPTSTYYPGARGLLREIFEQTNLNNVKKESRSLDVTTVDRLWLNGAYEFINRNYFAQRLTGFFVPPRTSLYTFNVRSDDQSRVYLSNNMSTEGLTRIISVTRWTSRRWNRFSSQTAEPVLLEKDVPYYLEVLTNEYGGLWELGLGAKLHDSILSGGDYDADKESQRIEVESELIQEEHLVEVEAQPHVYIITIQPSTTATLNENVEISCMITLSISKSDIIQTVMMSPFANTTLLENELNKMSLISQVGRVSVMQTGYQGRLSDFWSTSDAAISLEIIFATRYGVSEEDIPMIELDSSITCGNISGIEIGLTASGTVSQTLTPTTTFMVGFNNTRTGVPRTTSQISVDASTDVFEEKMKEILSWGCTEDDRIMVKTDMYFDYETSSTERSDPTAFCGFQSKNNPGTVRGSTYQLATLPYICFAYKGSFPGLVVQYSYRRLEKSSDGINTLISTGSTSTTLNSNTCSNWPFNEDDTDSDGWISTYGCVDVRACVNQNLPSTDTVQYDNHKVTNVRFNGRSSFYIDNLAFARSTVQISRIQNLAAIQPNGVLINDVEVSGGLVQTPTITTSSQNGIKYAINVASFNIKYNVIDCGFGMGLIESFGDNSGRVKTSRVQAGSMPVDGLFDITIGDRTLSDVNVTTSRSAMEKLFNIEFKDQGEFSINRGGSCTGYRWTINWLDARGDQPPIQVSNSRLTGAPANITVTTLVDGGLWIRPIGGDMLRLPETKPQVEVIINQIPSSCRSKNCSFSYEEDSTPQIFEITPSEGLRGTTVTIHGSGFSDEVEDIEVVIGRSQCNVIFANESLIQCTAGAQSAGCYAVSISIEGMGVASSEEAASFEYLVRVESISPSDGGIGGGNMVTITGEGFPMFAPDTSERKGPHGFLPWFRHGLGLPTFDIQGANYCPSFYTMLKELDSREMMMAGMTVRENLTVESLHEHVEDMYSMSPLQVSIGKSPCLIIEATIFRIRCVPMTNPVGSYEVTVTVFNQSFVLSNMYTVSNDRSVTVQSVSPSSGSVVGDPILIVGNSFASSPGSEAVNVIIGSSSCEIQSYNNTHIVCITPRMEPGPVPVFVSSRYGTALIDGILAEMNGFQNSLVSSLFPTFTYELKITNASLSRGSAFGGTEVTIFGGIFVSGETSVLVGEKAAEIVSVSKSQLTFLTPSSSTTHSVALSAKLVNTESNTVTYQFFWSTNEFSISVGDAIEWNLEIELNVDQQLEIEIFETLTPESTLRKTGGFHSTGNSKKFTVAFNEVGTYYFTSRNNLNGDLTFGEISVTEPDNVQRSVEILVGGIVAKYAMEPLSSDNLPRKRRAVDCEAPLSTDSSNELMFVYSPCFTPTVFSITPNVANTETTFTIRGDQFSTESNIVTVGGFPCISLTETETEITCKLSSNNSIQPPAYTPLLVSVRNTDAGYGNAYVSNLTASTVTLYPLVTSVSPSMGSLGGGTDVILSGTSLNFIVVGMDVQFGPHRCLVTSVQYTTIECKTMALNLDEEDEEETSTIQFYSGEEELIYFCSDSNNNCTFSFSEKVTPEIDEITPTVISSPGTQTITLIGERFSSTYDQYSIIVGTTDCPITSANSTVILCEIPSLPAGRYMLKLTICNLTNDGSRCFGNGVFDESAQEVIVEARVTGVSPGIGSMHGETEVTLSGSGLSGSEDSIVVSMGDAICDVVTATSETIVCITSDHVGGTVPLIVTDQNSVVDTGDLMFEFTANSTPMVTSIVPSSGTTGQIVAITGAMFVSTSGNASVTVGGVSCDVQMVVNDSYLTCKLGPNFAGSHPVVVTVPGLGSTGSSVSFIYTLVINSISSNSGSFAGGNTLQIEGSGFDPSETTITICDQICSRTSTIPTVTTIDCIVPSMGYNGGSDITCNVTVQSMGQTLVHSEQYTYLSSLTAMVTSINDTRGGTEGGTPVLIKGSGFTANVTVTIANSPCQVFSRTETEIVCTTNRSGRTVRALVMVWVDGKGFAISQAEFWYVDLWSSVFTWGGGPLPREGDFVVIPKGQTLVLDTKTPVLAYLLIQGGQLIFDREKGDNEVELHTNGGLITSGGRLEVGTEEEPFLSKTQIVLYGHVLSTEIPVYGAKTLALRKGEIDMHGRPLNVTWTRLRVTANAESATIELQDHVDWDIGGKIVIASTSFSQRENEEKEIANIVAGPDGSILTLTDPLEYEHISVEQTIAGRKIETRGEVGYLTRNIVVRGNRNKEWEMEVPDCPEEFRPGQFQTQTCFQGRFGSEVVGDQFGSQIMIHAAEQNQGHVQARFEYIEVTHAGQAFRLGRYPIHYHLNGNVSGSYVRGCGIHHTFNRAVTMHAVDYLLVEKNVAYNILGHAYFLEDGIEEFNIIQDNLGIFVRASSSLLNVDITPATFWVVNPNNILRRNAAAGGTHFGFWYRLPQHPTGPSFTSSVCPRKIPVLQFENNTAHSFGWYGLWVFQNYYPTVTGSCDDNTPGPARFDKFFAWRNDRGVEFSEVGSMQLHDSVMLDNVLAGVEYTEVESVWDDVNGPLVSNTLIVGRSEISAEDFCTESGLVTPKSYYLTVSGVTFANFDKASCIPISACSHCKVNQGGFETRYEKIRYINAGDRITRWKWPHEQIHRDLDGSLTNSTSPKLLIPTNDLLDPSKCHNHPESAKPEGTQGSICDGDLRFGRLAVFNTLPSSLEFVSLNVTNKHGKIILPYVIKRLRGAGPGQMMQVQLNQSYELAFQDSELLTNISYTTLISGFSEDDYIFLSHVYPKPIDIINIAGITTATNASVLNDPATSQTGDFYIGNDSVTLTYIIKGGDDFFQNEMLNRFQTEKCAYPMCIPPPPPTLPPPISPGRPDNAVMWSNTSIWPNSILPTDGQNVTIPRGTYVIADVSTLPRMNVLIIQGGLEVLDNQDRTLEANAIIIDGGRLVAGYPDTPFRNKLRIILHGNANSPVYRHGPFNTIVGSKAIGVFGELILHSVHNPKAWTMLGETANKGSNEISVSEAVDWEVGDEIVITSTTFDAYQTETFQVTGISNNKMVLTLNASLGYTHLGVEEMVNSVSYSIRAEVGRLTRNIVIENGDPDIAIRDAFGCRVLVDRGEFVGTGTVQLEGVEFKGCGQLGFTDSYDPRFALAFLNTGRQSDAYVRYCSFHDGYNTAIGMFGTDNMEITSNVIHSTVGPSMIVTGTSHRIVNNLASLSQFIGTYRNRNELENNLWTANFEIAESEGINFTHNHAAGGARAGIHTDGEDCVGSSSVIRHNVAHSSLHCFHVGYSDGSSTLCSRFDNLTAYACNHYGLFYYSQASLQLSDSTFINNKAAIYSTVFKPSALSHVVGKKTVHMERLQIISASKTFDCSQDDIIPDIANHPVSHSPGLLSPTGGHIGIVQPTFFSVRGGYPKFPWPAIHGYPAIAGLSTISEVSFTNFGLRCANKKDVVITTSRFSEDANHPVQFEKIRFESDGRFTSGNAGINNNLKVFVQQPSLGRVNPSDCVDMDCDGMKHVILTDTDGSFTETGGFHTIISRAEFQWGGDRRRGLGDYRIPKTMLTRPDGSRIPVDEIYPKKGVVRSHIFGGSDDCTFNEDWNMYLCENLEHLLLVLESLDDDTEVRRLSPVGVGANGFINLLNGPMDHGWCGGYTCQERISTFYGIVASSFNYTVGLTSTNPQKFAFHLLNANETQGIVVRIIYTNPQRLDVYVNNGEEDVYVPPKNAKLLDDGNLEYVSDPNMPTEDFFPTMDDVPGANFYDRSLKQLHINIRGNPTYKIITTPVIVLSVTLSVTTEDFFAEEFLVRNLALLLNIPSDRIRVVNVVRENSRKRRRRKRQTSGMETIEVEIGDPPTQVIATETNTTVSVNMTMNMTDSVNITDVANTTNSTSQLTFTKLTELTEMVAAVVQTGEILQGSSGVTLVEAEVEEPEPPPVDPTGGVRATPSTGGPQPEDVGENTTLLTFYDKQRRNESAEENATSTVRLSLPSSLVITKQLTGSVVEGIPLSSIDAPEFTMYDNNGMVSETLGIGAPWKLTAIMTSGPNSGFLSNHVVKFSKGRVLFEGVVFSQPGTYHLLFNVTFPQTANFSVPLGPISVQQRPLSLRVHQQPENGNTTFPLYPYPVVRLVDNSGAHLQTHAWRNVTWYVSATLESGKQEWIAKLVKGEATFRNIKVSTAGKHRLTFNAVTDPKPSSKGLLPAKITSDSFKINNPQFTRFIITYEVDYDATVKGNEAEFISTFENTFKTQYKDAELFGTNITRGSIIVSTFVTSRSTRTLVDIINMLLLEGNETLTLNFGNRTIMPSGVTQDPRYPVYLDNHLILILATTIPGGVIILGVCLILCVVLLCRKKKTTASNKLKVKVKYMSNLHEMPQSARGVTFDDEDDVAEFYLKDKNKFEEDERSEAALMPEKKLEVVSSMVEVPGSFYENSSALEDNKVDLQAQDDES